MFDVCEHVCFTSSLQLSSIVIFFLDCFCQRQESVVTAVRFRQVAGCVVVGLVVDVVVVDALSP